MKIGIDCRLAGLKNAGIGRYISNLVERLPKLSSEIEWVFFFHDQAQVTEVLPKISNKVTIVITPIRHYTLEEQLKLPGLFRSYQLDLLHIPHFNIPLLYQGSMVVTIHDLLWHEQKGSQVTTLSGWKYWLKYLGYRIVVRQALTKAKIILVPAETIKKTITKAYSFTQQKIVVTKEGVDQKLVATTKTPSGINKQLLYVGSLYPHKNVTRVIDALEKLPDYTLLIAGSRSIFQQKVKDYIKQRKLTSQVKFLGFVPDKELQNYYKTSFALVQPSLSEGFGLTGLEAMAAGGRVIASDIPIFREIYGKAALLFDPHSSDSFVQAVKKLEQKPNQLALASKNTVAGYSWDTMAEQTLAAYQKVLAL